MRDYMKIGFIVAMAGILVLGLLWFYKKSNPDSFTREEFKATKERITEDMRNKSVPIPPIGQLWTFTPEQELNVTILQTKSTEEGAIVVVRVSAVASISPQAQPPQGPKEERVGAKESTDTKNPPALPIVVHLNGIAKLHYEHIAGEWHLADIQSVNLRASQK